MDIELLTRQLCIPKSDQKSHETHLNCQPRAEEGPIPPNICNKTVRDKKKIYVYNYTPTKHADSTQQFYKKAPHDMRPNFRHRNSVLGHGTCVSILYLDSIIRLLQKGAGMS